MLSMELAETNGIWRLEVFCMPYQGVQKKGRSVRGGRGEGHWHGY